MYALCTLLRTQPVVISTSSQSWLAGVREQCRGMIAEIMKRIGGDSSGTQRHEDA